MKKIMVMFISAAMFAGQLFSQQIDLEKLKKPQFDPNNPLGGQQPQIKIISDIDFFPQPNFAGRKAPLKLVNGQWVAPFDLTHASFRVPAGKIVYIKKCDLEFPYENAYDTDQANINLTGICFVRTDDAAGFQLAFNGISTVIHNNDCKKIFGKIKVIVKEIAPDGTQVFIRLAEAGTAYRGTGAEVNTFIPFINANASTTPSYGGYVYDAAHGVPVISRVVFGRSGVGYAVAGFRLGASAIRDGRVTIFITSDIASAHKSGDFSEDFSSNVHMAAPVTKAVPLNKIYEGSKIVNAASPKFVLGPFLAHGSRDRWSITASAGIDIDFRAHFTVTGL